MEKERVQVYVASLERVVRNTHLDLKEKIIDFEKLCRRVTPDRMVPLTIIGDIHKTHQEIQEQLTKISGVSQLLESRYKRHSRRNYQRDREITEFVFFVKNLYKRFESTLLEIEAKKERGEREEGSQGMVFPWFQSDENQAVLLRNLRCLYELGYKNRSDLKVEERRRIIESRERSLSLFILTGEIGLIDILQYRMRLREYDIKERYALDELRGALTHLKGIFPSETEAVIRRFMDSEHSLKLKCLIFSVQSQKDLGKEILGSTNSILRVMAEGEVKTVQV